jgi:hypothetical protein
MGDSSVTGDARLWGKTQDIIAHCEFTGHDSKESAQDQGN